MTAPARVLPLRSPLARTEVKRSPLRLVPPRRSSAAKTPFAVVLVALLAGGLLGLLLLNTLVAQESFAVHDLNAQGKALQQQEQDLARQVQALQAPASLADRAGKLGMVPGGPPAFLRLSDGRVLGKPQPGVAPVVPKPATNSTTWTAPKPTTTTKAVAPTTVKPAAKPTTGAHR